MLAPRDGLNMFCLEPCIEKVKESEGAPGHYVARWWSQSAHQSRFACPVNLRPSDCEVALFWTEDDAVVACQPSRYAAAVPCGESRNIRLKTPIFPVGSVSPSECCTNKPTNTASIRYSFGLAALIMIFFMGLDLCICTCLNSCTVYFASHLATPGCSRVVRENCFVTHTSSSRQKSSTTR